MGSEQPQPPLRTSRGGGFSIDHRRSLVIISNLALFHNLSPGKEEDSGNGSQSYRSDPSDHLLPPAAGRGVCVRFSRARHCPTRSASFAGRQSRQFRRDLICTRWTIGVSPEDGPPRPFLQPHASGWTAPTWLSETGCFVCSEHVLVHGRLVKNRVEDPQGSMVKNAYPGSRRAWRASGAFSQLSDFTVC